ncbi:Probable protein phosphatase 2C 42, partial [Linum perenne]
NKERHIEKNTQQNSSPHPSPSFSHTPTTTRKKERPTPSNLPFCHSTTEQSIPFLLRHPPHLPPPPSLTLRFHSFLHFQHPSITAVGVRAIEKCGMLQALMNLLSLCFRPLGQTSGGGGGGGREGKEGLLWYRDAGKYASGDFSMAVVQANQVLEDQSQIESGNFGTFVGVYDGHGGPEAARYVCDHLFPNFRAISAETEGVVTAETIRRAFQATEEGFTSVVSQQWSTKPQMATVGSCCLVGVIFQQTLFVANLGDSRVVLGKKVGNTGGVAAIQLSTEHNASLDDIRHELKELHPDDPQIVVLKHGVWRVKGIIQVSRSIGDVYMKHARFNREPISAKFRLPEPMNMPIMSASPTILTHPLHPSDSFLIFASDGLWEHLSNEEAVEIVQSHPHVGSAKRLVKAALQEAARKREMRYADLRKIDKKVRRHFHDDITVVVLFLNHDLVSRGAVQHPPVSVRSALEH